MITDERADLDFNVCKILVLVIFLTVLSFFSTPATERRSARGETVLFKNLQHIEM